QLPAAINIFINDSISQISILNTKDSLLYIDSLLPNKTYKLKAASIDHGVMSSEISVTTMDTTSHNFTFEAFIFGGGGEASFINDVAIIDENNIWAVGEIYLPDSLGNPDPQAYGIGFWNGQNWQFRKLFNNNIPVSPRGILVLGHNDIYLSAGSVFHWDGVSLTVQLLYSRLNLPNSNGTIERLWGSSGSSIYGVGNAGSLIYYNGNQWSIIQSGTEIHINDAWGIVNDNNETIVYCPVSSFFTSGDKKILKIKNNLVDSISWNMNRLLYSVWTNSERYLYVSGSGVFENKNGTWKEIPLPQVSTNRIRGNNINDIFIAGDFGFTAHFNGLSWLLYNELYDIDTQYYSGDIKGNVIV